MVHKEAFFMNIKDLLLSNRSYRRFAQAPNLSHDDLVDLIDSVRLSPSARNDQVLRFILVNSKESCDKVFPHTAWAGYLKDWPGPTENERPSSYIIILTPKEPSQFVLMDVGIASQSILLRANAKGFGGCMLGSIKKKAIREIFDIDEKYEISLAIALGKPIEKVVIEDIKNQDTRYYRDSDSVHHVPKRKVDELILKSV
jgi:nitroreductase